MLRKGVVFAVILAAMLLPLSCHQAFLTAPPGSTMVLTANPTSIPAYGGVSIISAVIFEPAGTLVPDGTVVQFFTNLGMVEERGLTNDGVARVKLTSDTRSGKATVMAFSGGGAAPAGTPDDTTAVIARALAADGGGASDQVEVTIGAVLVKTVLVLAVPGRIVYPVRDSQIVATVLDASGNPVPNLPLLFAALENEAGDPAKFETLDSNGAPVFTDNNGRAYDRLRTRYNPSGQVRWVQVAAIPPTGEGSSFIVQIN